MMTAEYLRRILDYDPETGIFRWAEQVGLRAVVGSEAGHKTKAGYIKVTIGRTGYRAHRLAFLYMTGEWPTGEVDHRDCDGRNNKWDNLRPATAQQNRMNTRRRSDNKSGFKGVSFDKGSGKWRARFGIDGKKRQLGQYERAEDAHAAYLAAVSAAHPEFWRAE